MKVWSICRGNLNFMDDNAHDDSFQKMKLWNIHAKEMWTKIMDTMNAF